MAFVFFEGVKSIAIAKDNPNRVIAVMQTNMDEAALTILNWYNDSISNEIYLA